MCGQGWEEDGKHLCFCAKLGASACCSQGEKTVSKAERHSLSCPFPGQRGRKLSMWIDEQSSLVLIRGPGLWKGSLGDHIHLDKLRNYLPELGFRNIHLSENEWIFFPPESYISPPCITRSITCLACIAWLKGNVNEWSGYTHSSIFLTDEEFHLQFTLLQRYSSAIC